MDTHNKMEKPKEFKSLSEFLAEEDAKWEAKTWYEKAFSYVEDFLWHKIIVKIIDFPREAKWKFQEWTKGYSDCDIWNLNDFIIRKVRRPLKEYVKYQSEQGHSLPQEFATDPAAWLVVLKKIEYSFDQQEEEKNGEFFYSKMNSEQMVEYNKKVQEGFELFGRHLLSLWD